MRIRYNKTRTDTYIGKTFLFNIEAEGRIYASVNQSAFVQIMACRLVGAKPLSEPMLEYC